MLLNPDVEVLRADWLERLIKILDSGPRIGITGTEHNYRPIGPTFGAIDGHCFLMRREVYADPAIGPLDERYPWNGSPYVLTARAWAKGWIYRVHPPRPKILLHHGARSRAEADRPMPNVKLDPEAILKEAGLSPWREPRIASYARRPLIRWGLAPRA
jgi:GT2 family glycosyltransferase